MYKYLSPDLICQPPSPHSVESSKDGPSLRLDDDDVAADLLQHGLRELGLVLARRRNDSIAVVGEVVGPYLYNMNGAGRIELWAKFRDIYQMEEDKLAAKYCVHRSIPIHAMEEF